MYKIAFGKISALFNAISSVEKLYVPTDKDDIAVFAEYRDGVELTQKLNTNRSAKDFFFPQTENLYDVKMKDKKNRDYRYKRRVRGFRYLRRKSVRCPFVLDS